MEKYEVQELIWGTWENVWSDGNDIPLVFNSIEEAQQELNEFIFDQNEAFEHGAMVDKYDKDNYRIVKVKEIKMKVTKEMIEKLHDKTEGGYSYDRYNSWRACCRLLLKIGFTMEQAEVILLSKWMRWAGDYSSHDYGKITSKDLEKYLVICHLQDYIDMGIGDAYYIYQEYAKCKK